MNFLIDFSVDVSDVGFGLFDPNFSTTIVRAFDRGGDLLEALNPPTGPIGGTFSTYVGFSRTQGDIAQVVVEQFGDLLGVDNISWRVADIAPVPLPAAGWLMVAAFAGLAGLKRGRRA